MSVSDTDLKKRVKKAASLLFHAPVLKVPQAMRAANFTNEESSDPTMQMKVRRAFKAMKEMVQKTESKIIGRSVSVLFLSPTTSTISSLTASDVPSQVEHQMTPPKLDEVRLTVTGATKTSTNKQKIDKWKSAALKAATLMYHNELQKENGMSAEQVEQVIRKRYSGTGPSARTIIRYVVEYKLVNMSPVKRGSPGNIPPSVFESLCVAVESYISINQINKLCGNKLAKKELAAVVNTVAGRETEHKSKDYKLLKRIAVYKNIDLSETVHSMSI